MKKVFFVISLLFSVNACAQVDSEKSITNQEFRQLLEDNPTQIILDVRTPQELSGPLGKIDNAINIPVQELNQRINELDKYKDKEIIIICRTQNRSSVAVDILSKYGFSAKCVLGGMTEYRNKIKKSE